MAASKEVHLAFGCVHIPFHDRKAIRAIHRLTKLVQPTVIHLLGDIVDLDQLSRFIPQVERRHKLQPDLDLAASILAEFRDLAPKADFHYHEGNHDFRMEKYLRTKAAQLAGLRCLTIPEQLRLKASHIQYHSWQRPYKRGQVWFTHGTIARKWSGYSARAMVERTGGSVVHAHTHRISLYWQNHWDRRRLRAAEVGCLCQTSPEYIEGSPNWQQGACIVTFHGTRRHNPFQLELAEILPSGKFLWHGALK